MQPRTRTVFAALALLVAGLGVWRQAALPQLSVDAFALPAFAPTLAPSSSNKKLDLIALREVARYDIPMPPGTPAAHASFLLADQNGRLRAFWFAGSRESGEDVQILTSQFVRTPNGAGSWSTPTVAVNRQAAFQALGAWNPFLSIRRLGNPVAWVDSQGNTHLYVVATTWLGGWAASRILHLTQAANGGAYVSLGFLELSPFFNISHLVRGAPVPLTDGGVLLPIYFELGIKYPLAIRLDRGGQLVQARDAVVRMAGNLASLQPTVAVSSSTDALAYLRDNSEVQQLRFAKTNNGGLSWENASSGADDITNPDSSIAALRVAGKTLLVHNPQRTGRHRLVIDASSDGLRNWQRLATLESEPQQLAGVPFNEYSYPSAVVMRQQLHVSYTYQKRQIRHVVFNIESDSKEAP